MNARHIAIATAVGVFIGLFLGALLNDPPADSTAPNPVSADAAAPRPEVTPNDSAAELAVLRDALAFERDARFAMAEELDQVWEELAKLGANTAKLQASAARSAKPAAHSGKGGPEQWFDREALLSAGLPEADANHLKELFEANQLEELYLRDLATREGWLATRRYGQELQALRDQLRTDVGDEDYDWVLWASGRNNRVAVDDVLQNSAAQIAGLLKGDVIVRYDGELMLSTRELRRATLSGTAGETIAIDALRGTEQLRLYVPRGPLGTRLGPLRGAPGS